MGAEQQEIPEPTSEIPGNLRRALVEDREDPLVLIAAARVLWRFPWRGDALRIALSYFSSCSVRLTEEARKPQFFPSVQLRPNLLEMLRTTREDEEKAYGVLMRAALHFRNASEERSPEPAERMAVEEALRFLGADVRESAWFSREKVEALSAEDRSYLITGGFARAVFEGYDEDRDARQALGNEIVRITWSVWNRLGPEVFDLFRVYQALFPRAQRFWIRWQEKYEGDWLPNFIPTYAGYLSVSWQVAWAASRTGPQRFLTFLNEALESRDAKQRLAALSFAELVIRYRYQGGEPEFGGGIVASDVEGIGSHIATGEVSVDTAPEPQTVLLPPEPVPPPPAPAPQPTAAAEPEVPEKAKEGLVAKLVDRISGLLEHLTWAHRAPPESGGDLEKAAPSATKPNPPEPAKEDSGEHATAEMRPAAPVAVKKIPHEPGKRYADFTFYRRSRGGKPRAKVAPREPLAKTETYDLEVAIRTQPSGVPMREPKERKGIQEPKAGKPVEVLVVASSEDFFIPEPVQRLSLPPSGNSINDAVFKEVKPRRTTASRDDLAKISVSLLYNLNLLEHAILDAEVVASLERTPSSKLGLESTTGLHQELNFREYRNFELIQPRQMNIFVKGVQGGFELAFTLLRDGKPDIVLTGATRVSETGLESTLAGIRRTLLGISVWDEFGTGIECPDETKFQEGLRGLAKDGRELWTKLFELDVDSALFHIGDWLKKNPLADRSLIQISIDPSASRFVLPWNLLYDRDPDQTQVDVKGFWGLRYRIEQETDQEQVADDSPTVLSQPLEIGFLVSRFQETALQETFLNEMAGASKGRIARVQAIDAAADAFDYLQNHAKQLVLFFAHGHTQFPEAGRVGASEADFLTMYKKLPEKSQLRKAWGDIYESVSKNEYDSDKSWIKLQYGKLFLLDL